MSAADFLLSPEVQKILKVVYAGADELFPAQVLGKAAGLEDEALARQLEHLVGSGILTRTHAAQGEQAEPLFSVNRQFVFHDELRRIALKSFAAAEPIRAMLRAKFKDSVVQAFILGEDEAGVIELLVVHGESTPEQAAMSQAIHKLSRTIGRDLSVHVMAHSRVGALNARDALASRLRDPATLEIIKSGETKAKLATPRAGFLVSARKTLAAFGK